jgi:RP/EB family microtubule-associated protein
MMDGAYFTSRRDIIEFFNELLDMNISKIEQTASGAVACQIMDYIFPESVVMKRVNWEAKAAPEFIQNYKILQAAFNKNNIQKHVDVDKLVRAKYQDNLEFCQWLKAFFDQAAPPEREDYNALAVRSRGKGGGNIPDHFQSKRKGGGGTSSARPVARRPVAPRPMAPRPMAPRTVTSRPALRSSPQKTSASPIKKATPERPVRRSTSLARTGRVSDSGSGSAVADAALTKKNKELTARNAELEMTLNGIERERDFYFEKLRDIEVMLQVHEEKGEDVDPAEKLIKRVFKVLYATTEENVVVNDEGEVSVLY